MAWARESLRAYWRGPMSVGDKELAKWFQTGPSSSTGIFVNEDTALTYSAVWAAVSLIASSVASLPLVLYKKLPDGGKEKYEAHPLYRLLHDRPNSEMGSMVFREALTGHLLTYGNAYSEIQRDGADRPVALWPITPDRVQVVRQRGELYYRVSQPGESDVFLDKHHMLHVPGFGFNGVVGYGVVARMRESIGLGLATETFGGSFFGNGTTFGGVFQTPNKLSEQARKNFTESINARHQGVDRAHKFMVVEEGMTYAKLGVDPDHAQFLETRIFQLDEVARWLNIPPHKLKNLLRSTNNNIEHQNLEWYIDCLRPLCERWEQELRYKLIAPSERNLQDIEHIFEGLLRGDSAARGEFHSKQFNTASITPNEIRALENRNPIAGGDRAFIDLNKIPLDRYDEFLTAKIESMKPQPPAPVAAPVVDPNKQRELEVLTEERDLARKKAQAAEDAKDLAHARLEAVTVQLLAEQDAHRADLLVYGQLESDLNTALTERDVSLAKAKEDWRFEAAERQKSVARELECVAALDTRTQERDAAIRQTESLSLDVVVAQRERDDLSAKLTVLVPERDALHVRAETADAVTVELRAQIATLMADAETRHSSLIEAREALVRANTLYEELAVTCRSHIDTSKVSAAALDVAQKRLTDAAAMAKLVVVDRLRQLVEIESERARRVQGSPDKLRKWMESFYVGHAERCREMLKPCVRAWNVCTGGVEPLEHVLDVLIAEYLSQSERQLRSVADEHDSETLAPALEKVLRRWEADRAETVADRVLKEAA